MYVAHDQLFLFPFYVLQKKSNIKHQQQFWKHLTFLLFPFDLSPPTYESHSCDAHCAWTALAKGDAPDPQSRAPRGSHALRGGRAPRGGRAQKESCLQKLVDWDVMQYTLLIPILQKRFGLQSVNQCDNFQWFLFTSDFTVFDWQSHCHPNSIDYRTSAFKTASHSLESAIADFSGPPACFFWCWGMLPAFAWHTPITRKHSSSRFCSHRECTCLNLPPFRA